MARMDHLYGWKVQPDSVVPVTGIVSGFNVAARAFGSSKKGYLVQPPVYNEFHEVKNNVGLRATGCALDQTRKGQHIAL